MEDGVQPKFYGDTAPSGLNLCGGIRVRRAHALRWEMPPLRGSRIGTLGNVAPMMFRRVGLKPYAR